MPVLQSSSPEPSPQAGACNALGMTEGDLQNAALDMGLPGFRGRQIFAAIFARRAREFATVHSLPKQLRQNFAQRFSLQRPHIDRRQIAVDGTRKYRFVAPDTCAFEAVYIPVVGGTRTNTLCISSQTGCAVGCKFCYTASLRRNRNLSAAEIVGQVVAVQDDVDALGGQARVTNIVFMGMGEPLLNFDNVVQAAQILLHARGLQFSGRRVTLSTSGIVPRIRSLGALYAQGTLPLQLAISLNATTDAVRDHIMPINKKWPIAQLIAALRDFPLLPRRRFTIEYVLLGGLNDTDDDARRLVTLLEGLAVKVNLLPLNPHDRTPFCPPTSARLHAFQNILRRAGLHALVRTARGQDISAACGQLGESAQPAPVAPTA